MIYDEYLVHAESQRWILEVDVAWNEIDRDLALSQPDLLDQVRDSALIESYFPIYTSRLMRAMWDQVDVTAVFSIQLYESYKHFYVLNRYLELVGHRPIEEADVIAAREKNLDTPVGDPLAELARYMMSEHFAAYFFLRLSRKAPEPVLQRIADFISKDEFRHTQFAFDLLQPRLRDDPSARERVLATAADFHHLGSEVVEAVPIAEKNDFQAILTLDKKIHRLCGQRLSDYARHQDHDHRPA